MSWIFLILTTLIATELLMRLPVLANFKGAQMTARKSVALIANKSVSDHWKEMVLPRYAKALGTHSILGLIYLVLALLPFALFALFKPGGWAADMAFLSRLPAIALMLISSLAYLWLRLPKGSQSGSDYSKMDQFLHRIALGNGAVAEMTHDLDKAINLKSSPAFKDSAPIFVCGLARAGTTILLRELYSQGAFATLTYKDMPFVLAPNLWGKLSKSRAMETTERAHGDGIKVNLDSPEALDEVYWRIFDGDAYIKKDHLTLHQPNSETIDGYAQLAQLVMKKGSTNRYLSKNNNTILRIPALAQAFPDAKFLVPIRDPLSHANSLLKQHKRFSDSDGFTQNYMTWLGHHEFGATHRPFQFGDKRASGDPETLDYWLTLWIAAHEHLLRVQTEFPSQVLFISNEKLGSDVTVWPRLCAQLGIENAKELSELRSIPQNQKVDCDQDLAEQAANLYAQIPQFD